MSDARDGFSIIEIASGEEVDFIECSKGGSMRERSFRGLLINMDRERYCVSDTRDGDDEGGES